MYYDFEYNRDYARRQKLLGLPNESEQFGFDNWCGGTCRFTNLNVDVLEQLLDEKFIDPDDCQNYAPSVAEIYEFLKEHPNFTAHGYAVSSNRDDYRISLEGVEYKGDVSPNDLLAFTTMFHNADAFTANDNTCYAWYD